MVQSLKEMISSADKVIIGIGEEWNWVKQAVHSDPRYKQLIEYCSREGNQFILPIVEYEYAYYNSDKKIDSAYDALRELVGDKNYFLVSDLFLQDAFMHGFDPSRGVFPCGNYMYLQTGNADDKLILAEKSDEFKDIVNSVHQVVTCLEGNIGEDSTFSKPFLDGKELYLNQKRSEYRSVKYNEKAYIDNWDVYLKYLSNTLNNKLLILELGVGLEYPTVVRWPFEKVTFVNKQAHLVRVHERLYHHTPEIEEKADSVAMNSVDYILQESKGHEVE